MADNTVEIDIDLVVKNALKAIDDLNKKFDSLETQTKKGSAAWETFEGVLSGEAVTKALEKVAQAAEFLFDVFIKQGIEAASEQEAALNQMNIALMGSGNWSVTASEGMDKFAASVQKSSIYSKDQILESEALIESLTHLSGDGLKQATQAAVDLAATMRIDLDSASRLIGKGAEGNTTAFRRLGISISAGKTEAQDFSNMLKALGPEQGAAAQQTHTFEGAMALAKNAMTELQVATGSLVTQNPAIITGLNILTQTLQQYTDEVDANKVGLKEMVTEGIFSLLDGIVELLNIFSVLDKATSITWHSAMLVIDTAAATIVGAITAILYAVKSAVDMIPGLAGSMDHVFGLMADESQKTFDTVSEDYKSVKADFQDTTAFEKAATAVKDFEVKFKAAVADQKAADDDYTRNSKANAAGRAATNEAMAEKQKQDAIKYGLAVKSWDDQTQKERVASLSGTFGTIATLTKSSNTTLFNIGKAAAMAQAAVDGAMAIIKSLASAPYPYNIVLAGLTGVAVAAQEAQIAQQSPPAFEQGGIVPGTSYTGDNTLIRVNSRESILTLQDQTDLFKMIRSGGGQNGGGSNVTVMGNVYAHSSEQVDDLIMRIRHRQEFGNAPRFVPVGG